MCIRDSSCTSSQDQLASSLEKASVMVVSLIQKGCQRRTGLGAANGCAKPGKARRFEFCALCEKDLTETPRGCGPRSKGTLRIARPGKRRKVENAFHQHCAPPAHPRLSAGAVFRVNLVVGAGMEQWLLGQMLSSPLKFPLLPFPFHCPKWKTRY